MDACRGDSRTLELDERHAACEPILLEGDVVPTSSPKSTTHSWARRGGVVGLLVGLVAGSVVLVLGSVLTLRSPWQARGPHDSTGMMWEEATGAMIEVMPPREKCSSIGQNCKSTKCCTFTGYLCYEKNSSWAGCLKHCKPGQANGGRENRPKVQMAVKVETPTGAKPFFKEAPPGPWTCNRPEALRTMKPASGPPNTTLFCFTVVLLDAGQGPGKKIEDLSLVRTQHHTKSSIFGCEEWSVFSEVRTWLSPGPPQGLWTIKVDYPKPAHRPNTKFWVNTPLFVNVWKAIKAEGKWAKYDWTVKVDPSTVFLPTRLRTILSHQQVTASGVYLENCKYVRYGFHGSLEVMSKKAATVMAEHAEDCLAQLPWEHAVHAHFRYMGEDKFAQKCMDIYGVDKVPSQYEVGLVPSDDPIRGLHTTITCPAHKPKGLPPKKKWHPNCSTTKTAAIHGFRVPKLYFECLAATQK